MRRAGASLRNRGLRLDYFLLSSALVQSSALVDVQMNKWLPSLLASASIYVAKRISDVEVCWNALLESETGYKLAEIKLCARDICMLLSQASQRRTYKAVF